MGAPKNERTLTVDEAARDGILAKRRRWDLVAHRGSSSSLPWTGEPLCIFSRGLFPRVMVTASRSPAVLPVPEIPREREAAVPLSSQSTPPADRGFSLGIDEPAGDIFVFLGDNDLVPRRFCILKRFLGVGSGFARMDCLLTADDVLVPVVTGRIVS